MTASKAFDAPPGLRGTPRPASRPPAPGTGGAEVCRSQAERLDGSIKGVAEPGGATDRAVVEGLRAWLAEGNPATAALRGAWVGADGKNKAAIVAILLLAVVLAPLLLLLILVGLLVISLNLKARASTTATG